MKKQTLLFVILLVCSVSFSQITRSTAFSDSLRVLRTDSLIRIKLVELALENPLLAESDARINGAQAELKKAKASWLSSIVVSGNINELVVNNSTINGLPASTLFPKYNAGINIPFSVFDGSPRKVAEQKIKEQEAQKEVRKRAIVRDVLIKYENLKEKQELYELQKQITDGQYSTYQQKQSDYAGGIITDIKEVNKEYESWVDHKSKQRTKAKDLAVAEIELQEIVGMKFSDVLTQIDFNK